ncbi:MAG: hypothetical protein M1522_08390 [Actinobacteria bacterium]|nr:hypothetical protein [Actinomycetota bacterium]
MGTPAEEHLLNLVAEQLEQVSVSEDARRVVNAILSDEGLGAIIDVMGASEILRIMGKYQKVERFSAEVPAGFDEPDPLASHWVEAWRPL